jgi:O-acetylserine/cysteine efflux transporter
MSTSRFRAIDFIAALGVVVIWGLNFVAMKFGLRAFSPFQLGAARYLFAVFPLILFVPRPQVRWVWVVGYGLLQGVGQFGLLFTGLHLGMTAALASVLMQTQVFFTAFFSFALLKERPDRPLVAGLVLAGLGLACMAAEPWAQSTHAHTSIITPWGFVLTLGAAAMWAASNLLVRRARETAPFEIVPFLVWSSLVPILPFLGLAVLSTRHPSAGPGSRRPVAVGWRWPTLAGSLPSSPMHSGQACSCAIQPIAWLPSASASRSSASPQACSSSRNPSVAGNGLASG